MATPTVRSNLDMESYSLRNMYLGVFVVKVTYMYVGMTLAWPFLLIPHLETFQPISAFEKVAIFTTLPLGMMLGPITGSALPARSGFRSVFLLFTCLSLMSVMLHAFHQMLAVYVARLAAGLAVGVFLCYAEAYLQDVSDREVIMIQAWVSTVFLTIGLSLVYRSGQDLLYYQMLFVMLLVLLVFLVCLVWLPESPYACVAAGNLEKAKESLDFLHRGISTRGLDNLMNLVQEDTTRRKSESEDYFLIPPYRAEPRASKVTLIFFTLLPLTGFPVVLMMMGLLVEEAKLDVSVNSSLSIMFKIVFFLFLFELLLYHYFSPKVRMISVSTTMCLSMAFYGIYLFSLENGYDVSAVSYVSQICIIIYTDAFLLGFVHKSRNGMWDARQQVCGRVLTLTAGFFSMCLVILLFFLFKTVLATSFVLWIFSAFSLGLAIFINVYSPEATFF